MQITILGSTGQIGKAVVKAALNPGYQVRVLVRSQDKLGGLHPNPVSLPKIWDREDCN